MKRTWQLFGSTLLGIAVGVAVHSTFSTARADVSSDAFQEVDRVPDPTNSSSPTSFKDDSYAITLDRTAGVVHILGKKPAPYGQRRGEYAIPLSRVLSLSK